MSEKFDVGKLIRGFNPFKGSNLGKIIFIIIIAGTLYGIFYKVFIKDTIGQQQQQKDQKVEFKKSNIENQYSGQVQIQEDTGWSLNFGMFGGKVGDDNLYGVNAGVTYEF